MPPFLNPRTVNAQDGYQRAPLHWACLNGEVQAVKLLLRDWKADTGLLDWFEYTSLHYAAKSTAKNPQILEMISKYNPAIGKSTQKTWRRTDQMTIKGFPDSITNSLVSTAARPTALASASCILPPTQAMTMRLWILSSCMDWVNRGTERGRKTARCGRRLSLRKTFRGRGS